MGACLDAGRELAKAYKDTPQDTQRQAAAVQNFLAKCVTGGGFTAPLPSSTPAPGAGASTAPASGASATDGVAGVIQAARGSGVGELLKWAFYGLVLYVVVVAGLAIFKRVRRI